MLERVCCCKWLEGEREGGRTVELHDCVCVTCSLSLSLSPHPSIQSGSVSRIPVVIVFTYMDRFKTRDQREDFRKKTLNWISYHNMKVQ